MPPNRKERAKIAQETLQILKQGFYDKNKDIINVHEYISHSIEKSHAYRPSELQDLRSELEVLLRGLPESSSIEGKVEVTSETSIAACRRLHEYLLRQKSNQRIGCLNFASAKNVCGGMIGGSLAQEESLGLCTSLYSSLSQFNEDYYAVNRRSPRDGLYNDNLIYSPSAVVIREDHNLTLLNKEEQFTVDFVSCPAVNRGCFESKGGDLQLLNETMSRRVENVLVVALKNRIDVLILGAWGCGVFKNAPEDVAKMFASFLIGPNGKFVNAFQRVVFAIGSDPVKREIFERILL